MRARVKGINLLPKEYIQAEQLKLVQMIVVGVVLIEVTVFIGGVAIPPKIEAKKVQQQLDDIGLKLKDNRFAEVNSAMRELEAEKLELEEWITQYGDLKQENFVSARVLDSLTARLPLGMAIDKVDIKAEDNQVNVSELERTITVEGTSEELESIINYVTINESIFGVGTVSYEGSYDEELMVYKYKLDITIPVIAEQSVEVVPQEAVVGESAEQTEGRTN